ncbi:hypothetical protein evm_000268 [Chilo suppressalis]|nr:hypothetical protein evm_000268 [Chilo suppressalis]
MAALLPGVATGPDIRSVETRIFVSLFPPVSVFYCFSLFLDYIWTMTARGRTSNLNNEWDMNDDFNNTTCDSQYPDENASGGAQYDHCRLYIRNIPKALNDEGLRTAFSKFGTLTEVFLSKDQLKKYALVRYETPGEAKLAMTKLNNTEPLGLNIRIAHKPKSEQRRDDREPRHSIDRVNSSSYTRNNREEDTASVGSRGINSRKLEVISNGEDLEDLMPPLDEDMDPDTKMRDIQLELQRLQVQERTMLLKKQLLHLEASRKKQLTQSNTSPSNRCVLPNGRVVVRNIRDRSLESRDEDDSFAAGAGDSLTLPALQRAASRACVACGAPADSYCSQCALTPYCSAQCQRRDWRERHRGVCHNLARLNRKSEGVAPAAPESDLPNITPAPPLRQPHSSPKRDAPPRRGDDQGSSGFAKKSGNSANTYNNNKNRSFNNNNNNRNSSGNRGGNFRQGGNRNQNNQPDDEQEEEWGNKNAQQSTPTTNSQPEPKPGPSAPKQEQSVPKPKPAETITDVKPSKPQDVATKSNTEENKVKNIPNGIKGPASLNDVTPCKKIIPKNYLLDLLSVGDTILLSVDANASECRSTAPGFVCLSMHERFQTEYQNLCEVYVVDCENEKGDYKPKPGESFSYFNPSDGGWYRARCVSPQLAALIDSSKLVPLTSTDKLKILPDKYGQYPEFCCILNAEGIKVGDNLKCTIVTKLGDSYKVSLDNVETGASVGQGEVTRWLPTVEYPKPAVERTNAPQPQIPEVPRPDVVNNSKVLLVDATAIDRVFVRPSDIASQKKFDAILEDVVMYGCSAATSLKEPPLKGQTVIGKFTDGLHYRALCKRTNVKQNKYLLEYIEFGNLEITPLENIYACPPNLDLSAIPSEVSLVILQCKCNNALTPPATEYLDKLKDTSAELTLTLPSGAKSAASGSAVCLTVVKSNESVNKKVEEMCTPEWKKMEERGADVVESQCLMFHDLEYLELPPDGCVLDVLDFSAIQAGSISACQRGIPHVANVLTNLTQRMAEYCESDLGKEPYLPKNEELCIARCPPYPQWFRAVLLDQTPGSATAKVCYVDYGNIEDVPVSMLRKMLPEFVRSQPALASLIEIMDFPKVLTDEMLARAAEYMQMNDEGRGILPVTKCMKQDGSEYIVEAPGLIKAMLGK